MRRNLRLCLVQTLPPGERDYIHSGTLQFARPIANIGTCNHITDFDLQEIGAAQLANDCETYRSDVLTSIFRRTMRRSSIKPLNLKIPRVDRL